MNKKNGLSRYNREKIMRAFVADLTATQAAHFLGFNRKTVNRYYGCFARRSTRIKWRKSTSWSARWNAPLGDVPSPAGNG